MHKTLGVVLAILFALGCNRWPDEPEPTLQSQRVDQQIVLSGFNSSDTVVVGAEGYRVGAYHDFSPYDSLSISFSAEQLDPAPQSGQLLVRIGPADYFRCSLAGRQTEIEIRIDCSHLAKPHSSAITFYAADPGSYLRLAHLRITGWSS